MKRLLAVLVVLVVLAGCGADKPLVRFVNTPPEATLAADPDTLALSDTSFVTCDVRDPDGDVMTYRWSSNAGRFIRRDPSMFQVSWIAPDSAGVDTIRVTVFDYTDSVAAMVRVVVVGHTGTVTGVVKDSTSGEGLVGARLEIAGRTGTSDANGSFHLELVPPGGDTLLVTREGYEPHTQFLFVREGINSVEVALQPAVPRAPLDGTVTNRHGLPVAGAVCRVGTNEVSTNPAGQYAFAGVPVGRQELQVRASGYYTARDTVDIQPPGVRHDVALRAAPPALPEGLLTVTKLDNYRLRLDWAPQTPPEAITGFNLIMIVSGENQGLPQPVPGGPLSRSGGTREVLGAEDLRYRFAVAAVGIDSLVGPAAPYSPIVVLTRPSSLVTVPAGPVIMGSYPDDYGNEEHPGNPVYVQAFTIETHEVTNRQFVAFLVEALSRGQLQVSAGAVRAAGDTLLLFAGSQVDRDPINDGFSVPAELRDYPVTGVTWYGAEAYARWHGRRLPKESEWERAARGAVDSTSTYRETAIHVGTRYPWGNAPPSGQLAGYGGQARQPVGSFPDGAARWWSAPVYDLAGNVWEWCDDWFGPYANPHQPPASGSRKVVRGGSGESPAAEIRVGYRWFLEPGLVGTRVGFRCATDPPFAGSD